MNELFTSVWINVSRYGNDDTFQAFHSINFAKSHTKKIFVSHDLSRLPFKKLKYDLNIYYRLIFSGNS